MYLLPKVTVGFFFFFFFFIFVVVERLFNTIFLKVQTGFGRTGTHFWGFESNGIVPDIVTMAKGIGNGYPLAALVTTPEIAASLSRATHFTTYGGSPLAAAVGKAVLEVRLAEKNL
jgi:4-aminobutyrate aminotransferase-like enzyme